MPKQKLLVEFLADFVRDEKVRCQTLRHERRGPSQYGLDPEQVRILNTFNLEFILEMAGEELVEIGVDLDAKLREVIGGQKGTFITMESAGAAAMYSGGQIHIRKLEPAEIRAGQAAVVTLLGNGFDWQPDVQFTLQGAGNQAEPPVLGVFRTSSCDRDLYQRISVEVTLPKAGSWTVQARNVAHEAWNAKDVATLTVR